MKGIIIEGEDLRVDDRGATPLGLVFHELATNASKYGALSVPEGRVTISSMMGDGYVTLIWEEENGPIIAGPPQDSGFGTRLTEISIVRQLNGTLERHWDANGLKVMVKVPAAAFRRT